MSASVNQIGSQAVIKLRPMVVTSLSGYCARHRKEIAIRQDLHEGGEIPPTVFMTKKLNQGFARHFDQLADFLGVFAIADACRSHKIP
jgi:hypothetical protein